MLRSIANQRSQSRFRDNVGLRQVSGMASVLHWVACAVFFVQGRCRSDRVSSRTRAAMNVLLRTTSASPTHTPPTSTSEVYACQFYAALLKNMRTAETPNMRQIYAEIRYRIAWNQLPHLVPQGSGHVDGAFCSCWQPDGWGNELW